MTQKVNPVTLALYSSPDRAIPQPSARRAVKLKNLTNPRAGSPSTYPSEPFEPFEPFVPHRNGSPQSSEDSSINLSPAGEYNKKAVKMVILKFHTWNELLESSIQKKDKIPVIGRKTICKKIFAKSSALCYNSPAGMARLF
ncbi:MAG TPA: hypothetical protein OIL76_07165 [Veillonellaceae bacterium]|nr:hypothetical protein [Veillonellaceae bacterium]